MKSLIQAIKDKKERKEQATQTIKKFVEGEMDVYSFWGIYTSDPTIKDMIAKKREPLYSLRSYFEPDLNQLKKARLDSLAIRATIFSVCKIYLTLKKIKFTSRNADIIMYNMFYDICPSWLQMDENYIEELLKKAPEDINKKEKIKWCKARIKEEFKKDKIYPKWLQEPEWPIIDGKPLVFKMQTADVDDVFVNSIDYIFYDPDTKKETIVTQYD
ncbi:MAG: hypothetical protein H6687_00780 [Bacillales bacterium]|nr:hypothetical protein [Bacillales bacterium]